MSENQLGPIVTCSASIRTPKVLAAIVILVLVPGCTAPGSPPTGNASTEFHPANGGLDTANPVKESIVSKAPITVSLSPSCTNNVRPSAPNSTPMIVGDVDACDYVLAIRNIGNQSIPAPDVDAVFAETVGLIRWTFGAPTRTFSPIVDSKPIQSTEVVDGSGNEMTNVPAGFTAFLSIPGSFKAGDKILSDEYLREDALIWGRIVVEGFDDTPFNATIQWAALRLVAIVPYMKEDPRGDPCLNVAIANTSVSDCHSVPEVRMVDSEGDGQRWEYAIPTYIQLEPGAYDLSASIQFDDGTVVGSLERMAVLDGLVPQTKIEFDFGSLE